MEAQEMESLLTGTAERAGWNERRIELLEASLKDLYERLEETDRRLAALTRRVEETPEE